MQVFGRAVHTGTIGINQYQPLRRRQDKRNRARVGARGLAAYQTFRSDLPGGRPTITG